MSAESWSLVLRFAGFNRKQMFAENVTVLRGRLKNLPRILQRAYNSSIWLSCKEYDMMRRKICTKETYFGSK